MRQKQNIKAQPGTADIDAALAKRKAYTRKLHAEVQTVIANQHHPSCRESDKDLVWHCSQCGLNEPAEEAHAAECEEALHAEVRRLRVDSNRFLRQRNELLQAMCLILASAQSWNGGWVGRGQDAKEIIDYVTKTATDAVLELKGNGQ